MEAESSQRTLDDAFSSGRIRAVTCHFDFGNLDFTAGLKLGPVTAARDAFDLFLLSFGNVNVQALEAEYFNEMKPEPSVMVMERPFALEDKHELHNFWDHHAPYEDYRTGNLLRIDFEARIAVIQLRAETLLSQERQAFFELLGERLGVEDLTSSPGISYRSLKYKRGWVYNVSPPGNHASVFFALWLDKEILEGDSLDKDGLRQHPRSYREKKLGLEWEGKVAMRHGLQGVLMSSSPHLLPIEEICRPLLRGTDKRVDHHTLRSNLAPLTGAMSAHLLCLLSDHFSHNTSRQANDLRMMLEETSRIPYSERPVYLQSVELEFRGSGLELLSQWHEARTREFTELIQNRILDEYTRSSERKASSANYEVREVARTIETERLRISEMRNAEMQEVNTRMAEASLAIAKATRQDSRSMRAIAIITMCFLPATFVSSFFGMNFFVASDASPGFEREARWVWIYFVASLPLTAIVLIAFFAWEYVEEKRIALEEKDKMQLREETLSKVRRRLSEL